MAEDFFNAMLSTVMWSVAAGGTFGFIWAVITCSSRKRSFISAGIPPTGQREWFVFSLFSMGGYIACITMLAMLTAAGALSHLAFWFLLVCSLGAFAAALLFGKVPDATLPEPMTHVPRHQAEPPRRPIGRPSWRPSLVNSPSRHGERLPGSEILRK